MMVPQVVDTLGSRFSTQQITDALRVANYDVDKTVVSLLESAKTSSAARTWPQRWHYMKVCKCLTSS